jgi:hypothetical protein
VLRTEPGDPLLRPTFLLEPLIVKAGPTVSLPFEIENTTPQPVVTAYVSVDGETAASTTLDLASQKGARYDLTVTLVAPDVPLPPEAPGTLVARVNDSGTVAVGAAFGPDESLADADVYERRYYVAVQPGRLGVQTPGLHYHRYEFDDEVWVRENVGPHVVERD